MVLFWELKFFDLMIRHHAGVMSENHKRGWNIANSHTLQSMDTFTVGKELLSLSYVMGGIEKSCLRHKYLFPIALTGRRNCKNRQRFP